MSVVLYNDLSGKELHRQVGTGRVMTSGSLGGVMVSTLAQDARVVGTIPILAVIFPMFITPRTISS